MASVGYNYSYQPAKNTVYAINFEEQFHPPLSEYMYSNGRIQVNFKNKNYKNSFQVTVYKIKDPRKLLHIHNPDILYLNISYTTDIILYEVIKHNCNCKSI